MNDPLAAERRGLAWGHENQVVLYIWIFAAVFSVAPSLLLPTWFINDFSSIDPLIYWGTAEVPEYAFKHFGDTYYVRRWTIVGPLAILQHTFDPVVAQFLYHTALLLLLTGVIGTLVYRMTSRVLPAFLSIGLVSTSAFTLVNVGQTYHQGSGLFLFFALCLLIWMLPTSRLVPLRSLTIGATLGLLVVTYAFSLYFVPALGALLWMRTRNLERNGILAYSRLRVFSFSIVGFLATITVIDLGVGKILGMHWELLPVFLLRFNEVSSQYAPTGNYANQFISAIVQPETFVLLTFALAALALVPIVHDSSVVYLRQWAVFSVLLLVPYLIGTPIKNMGLWWPWTNIYIFGVAIVTASLITAVPISSSNRLTHDSILPSAVIAAIVGVIWIALQSAIVRFWDLPAWAVTIAIASSGLLGLLLWALSRAQSSNSNTFGLFRRGVTFAIVLLVLIGLGGTSARWTPGLSFPRFASQDESKVRLVALSKDVRRIAHRALREDRRVWILDLRSHEGWSPLVSSMYGMYSALGLGMNPQPLDCESQADWILSHSNSTAVVIGIDSEEAARSAVTKQFGKCDQPVISLRQSGQGPEREFWLDLSNSNS